MTSRDDAVKVGADAMRADWHHTRVARGDEEQAAIALDAAHDAGLIVWADQLEEVQSYGGLAVYPGEMFRLVGLTAGEASRNLLANVKRTGVSTGRKREAP